MVEIKSENMALRLQNYSLQNAHSGYRRRQTRLWEAGCLGSGPSSDLGGHPGSVKALVRGSFPELLGGREEEAFPREFKVYVYLGLRVNGTVQNIFAPPLYSALLHSNMCRSLSKHLLGAVTTRGFRNSSFGFKVALWHAW